MRTSEKKTVAIVGGSGDAGGEFLRLALGHPNLAVTQVTSEKQANTPVGLIHPNLRGRTDLKFRQAADLTGADIVVLALPPGNAAQRLAEFGALGETLVDLGADFRLKDPQVYRAVYGEAHPAPDRLGEWVYGNPELHREDLKGAARIAAAGDFATSVILTLYPLLKLGALAPKDIIATGLLGSSAVGDSGSDSPCPSPHQPVGHRQRAEMQQELPGNFPLHLTAIGMPRVRGILSTVQAWVPDGWSERDVWSAYREVYGAEPFIRIVRAAEGSRRFPDPLLLEGTNYCDIGFEMDQDTGRVVLMSALDNLVKGTAGQAIQSLNIANGWEETAGLEFAGLHPA